MRLCLSIYSVNLPLYLSVKSVMSICPCVCLSVHSVICVACVFCQSALSFMPVCLSVNICVVNLSIFQFVLSTSPCVCLSVCVVSIPACLSVSLYLSIFSCVSFVCQSILSICPCVSVCQSILSICYRVSVCQFLPVNLPVRLSVNLVRVSVW